jgi:antirestriction protein ArdC
MKPNFYQAVTDQVLQLMQTHGSDWVHPWLASGTPIYAQTGQECQGPNVLILGLSAFSKKHATNYWATYRQ